LEEYGSVPAVHTGLLAEQQQQHLSPRSWADGSHAVRGQPCSFGNSPRQPADGLSPATATARSSYDGHPASMPAAGIFQYSSGGAGVAAAEAEGMQPEAGVAMGSEPQVSPRLGSTLAHLGAAAGAVAPAAPNPSPGGSGSSLSAATHGGFLAGPGTTVVSNPGLTAAAAAAAVAPAAGALQAAAFGAPSGMPEIITAPRAPRAQRAAAAAVLESSQAGGAMSRERRKSERRLSRGSQLQWSTCQIIESTELKLLSSIGSGAYGKVSHVLNSWRRRQLCGGVVVWWCGLDCIYSARLAYAGTCSLPGFVDDVLSACLIGL
jgi:hypothetical protein